MGHAPLARSRGKGDQMTKKKQESVKEPPYDHTETALHKALGITDKRFEDMQNLTFQFFQILKESDPSSKLAEKLEQSLSKRELVYLATKYVIYGNNKAISLFDLFTKSSSGGLDQVTKEGNQ